MSSRKLTPSWLRKRNSGVCSQRCTTASNSSKSQWTTWSACVSTTPSSTSVRLHLWKPHRPSLCIWSSRWGFALVLFFIIIRIIRALTRAQATACASRRCSQWARATSRSSGGLCSRASRSTSRPRASKRRSTTHKLSTDISSERDSRSSTVRAVCYSLCVQLFFICSKYSSYYEYTSSSCFFFLTVRQWPIAHLRINRIDISPIFPAWRRHHFYLLAYFSLVVIYYCINLFIIVRSLISNWIIKQLPCTGCT